MVTAGKNCVAEVVLWTPEAFTRHTVTPTTLAGLAAISVFG